MSNILLTDAMGDSSYGIEVTNHPLPNTVQNKVSQQSSLPYLLYWLIVQFQVDINQAPVVQRADSSIQSINRFPVYKM